MPDPRYEAEYGVGNVSAHRGEAYIAFYDFQLADYSNTLQAARGWKFSPAMKDGQPVEGWVLVPVKFEPPSPEA